MFIDEMLKAAAQLFIDQLTFSVIHADRKATGKSLESLEIVSTPGQVVVLCSPAFTAIETGRKPTPDNTAPSTPTLVQALIDWCRARGIPEGARFAIAKKIHKKGFEGTPGVITSVLNEENIGRILDVVCLDKLDGIINEAFTLKKL